MLSKINLFNPVTLNSKGETFVDMLKQLDVSYTTGFTLEDTVYDVMCMGTNVLVCLDKVSDNITGCADVNLHRNKTLLAEKNGYRCIHIFDWDDPYKVALMFVPRKKVYARKCSVEKIDQKTANDFLKKYHLQGAAKGQTQCYALYLNGMTVSVMTFGKPRYNKHYEWELIRLCYHPEYLVTGGSEKLWYTFLTDVNPKSVLSYCDRAKFTGNVYYKLGMKLKSDGQPSKHWYSKTEQKRSKHITNNFLLQRGYDQIFNESYGKGTDNEELIMKRGYRPVYDCGQMTFTWNS